MPSYNRAPDLRRALEAYERQTTPDLFEIIVVDDASTDNTYEVLTSYHPQKFRLRVERMEKNGGQGLARNRAIPLVSAPLMMFVGDDILPEPDFVEAHLAAHRLHPDERVAILGRLCWPSDLPVNTLMAHIDGIGAQQFSYHYLKSGQEYDFRHFYTSNISLKRSMMWRLDRWFDPDFVIYGYEDAELGYRLAQKGMRIIYSDVPVAYHYHYHNAFTFAQRQYRSGLMAHVLVRKHPELAGLIIGKGLASRRAYFTLLAAVRPVTAGTAEWFEEVALRLASAYEWQSHALLDQFYLKLYHYYFYKGLLAGSRPNPQEMQPVCRVYARRFLLYLLNWYLPAAQELDIPLPPGYDQSLLDEASRRR